MNITTMPLWDRVPEEIRTEMDALIARDATETIPLSEQQQHEDRVSDLLRGLAQDITDCYGWRETENNYWVEMECLNEDNLIPSETWDRLYDLVLSAVQGLYNLRLADAIAEHVKKL